jgi:hypothetical protein
MCIVMYPCTQISLILSAHSSVHRDLAWQLSVTLIGSPVFVETPPVSTTPPATLSQGLSCHDSVSRGKRAVDSCSRWYARNHNVEDIGCHWKTWATSCSQVCRTLGSLAATLHILTAQREGPQQLAIIMGGMNCDSWRVLTGAPQHSNTTCARTPVECITPDRSRLAGGVKL